MPPSFDREIIAELLDGVPELPRFLSAAELDEATTQLAREHAGTVRARRIGHSVHGDPILSLEVGEGPRTAVWFGAPHPNEPVGTLTVLELAKGLATHPEIARKLGTHFVLVPAIDRDGLRLNERWMVQPKYTLARLAQNYYRPPARLQVEWSFPYFDPSYQFEASPPETRALAHLIETHRPSSLYSLHNSNVGGVYYYLNRGVRNLESALVEYPPKLGLPLEPALPEEPWGNVLSPFVLETLSLHRAVDYLHAHDLEPRRVLQHGAGSSEFAESVNPDVLALMAEVPLFADPRSGDLTETRLDRATLEGERQAARERVVNTLRTAYQTVARGGMLREGTFRTALESALEFQTRRHGLAPVPSPEGAVTVSEAFQSQVVARFTDLRLLGVLHRFLGEQAAPGTFAREGLLQSVEDQIQRLARDLETHLQGRKTPLRDLVRVQLCAGLEGLRFSVAR